MHDERLAANETPAHSTAPAARAATEPTPVTPAAKSDARDRNRHSTRIGLGLIGLMGAAWAAVIAARYAELMPN
ncbi:hypothetical protein [Methylobacterium sp. A54F]